MLTAPKFYEKAQDFALVQNTTGTYYTLADYQAHVKPHQTDQKKNLTLLYATHPAKQDPMIQACTQRNYEVLLLDHPIDLPWISLLEEKLSNVTFKGIDTAPIGQLIDQGPGEAMRLSEADQKQLKDIYAQAVAAPSVTWAIAVLPEGRPARYYQRALSLFKRVAQSKESLPLQATISAHHPLAQQLLKADEALQHPLAQQAYALGLLAQDQLKGTQLTAFLQRSVDHLMATVPTQSAETSE